MAAVVSRKIWLPHSKPGMGAGWRYRFIPPETGHPPRSPWESVSGITGMYNGMVAPLKPVEPAGVLWYQGESNTESSQSYRRLLSALVGDWRRHFNRRLRFIVVQLPNYGPRAAAPAESGWAAVRNAQQQVALEDPEVGLVVTHDAGDDADIHPVRKWIVGVRAARVARALGGAAGPADGVVPVLRSLGPESATLEFSPPLGGADPGTEVAGFSLCARGACASAEASQSGSRVTVRLGAPEDAGIPGREDALRLRYCWSDGGTCALRAVNGLPVSSFELDLPRGTPTRTGGPR